ncbi:membrane protein sypL [Vibrio sp. JCM 19236]|nr:membrane protein sypL [Vibrio sp. JCM 19236]
MLAETGFLGLLVFIILIISLIRTAHNSLQQISNCESPYLYSASGAVYAGMIGTVVSGTFLTQGFVWPIYILAALIIAISRIVQIDSQNEKQNGVSAQTA